MLRKGALCDNGLLACMPGVHEVRLSICYVAQRAAFQTCEAQGNEGLFQGSWTKPWALYKQR